MTQQARAIDAAVVAVDRVAQAIKLPRSNDAPGAGGQVAAEGAALEVVEKVRRPALVETRRDVGGGKVGGGPDQDLAGSIEQGDSHIGAIGFVV